MPHEKLVWLGEGLKTSDTTPLCGMEDVEWKTTSLYVRDESTLFYGFRSARITMVVGIRALGVALTYGAPPRRTVTGSDGQ